MSQDDWLYSSDGLVNWGEKERVLLDNSEQVVLHVGARSRTRGL